MDAGQHLLSGCDVSRPVRLYPFATQLHRWCPLEQQRANLHQRGLHTGVPDVIAHIRHLLPPRAYRPTVFCAAGQLQAALRVRLAREWNVRCQSLHEFVSRRIPRIESLALSPVRSRPLRLFQMVMLSPACGACLRPAGRPLHAGAVAQHGWQLVAMVLAEEVQPAGALVREDGGANVQEDGQQPNSPRSAR